MATGRYGRPAVLIWALFICFSARPLRAEPGQRTLGRIEDFVVITGNMASHLAGADKVAVIDRNFSFGAGGIFAQEIRAALCDHQPHPLVYGYIAGLGGRDITPETIERIYRKTQQASSPPPTADWIDLDQEQVAKWHP